jgi:hypothetical protein
MSGICVMYMNFQNFSVLIFRQLVIFTLVEMGASSEMQGGVPTPWDFDI